MSGLMSGLVSTVRHQTRRLSSESTENMADGMPPRERISVLIQMPNDGNCFYL